MTRRVGVSRAKVTAEAYAEVPEGRELVPCAKCDGFGEVETSGFAEHGGPDMTFETCPKCFGSGELMRWELL